MTKQEKIFLLVGALSLSTGAMLSAYGFHGLESLTEADRLSWRWANQMQTYHSLGLILIAVLSRQIGPSRLLHVAGWLFIIGMLTFCGSVYAGKLGAPEAIGQVTPFGGAFFMVGWVTVALSVWLTPTQSPT